MKLNEPTKERISKLNMYLIAKLSENTGFNVYQDNVSETELNEELNGVYDYIIFSTGGFSKSDTSQFTLVQEISIQVATENTDDLDGLQVDIITSLEGISGAGPYYFLNSTKGQIQKGQQDNYVDALELNFTRSFKYVC
ncbi:hypothetical protein ACEXFN_001077 [Listeria monocytogenes]|uniref:Uncharacterized protein n=2 Tax=root TaxID=1 RepID=R4ICB4_9CAUD|nr:MULTISPECIES: hypothetical protein [Listeria]YP_008126705.2 hypothetical protein LP030nr2_009 [Listeria phage LP-030-2]EHR9822515.1 hypothetical protein [Listeria innocua]AFN39947.2 hypothetical protein LP030nr2_009 [Listeria phage LP-030-2]EHJ4910309.1 hypothetical protein [Listeria monocytogenes]EHN5684395.1 hypothetical protein [Listeria monocytogenes]EHN6893246.1 hypothetical protein [Listeria monocytogenes]